MSRGADVLWHSFLVFNLNSCWPSERILKSNYFFVTFFLFDKNVQGIYLPHRLGLNNGVNLNVSCWCRGFFHHRIDKFRPSKITAYISLKSSTLSVSKTITLIQTLIGAGCFLLKCIKLYWGTYDNLRAVKFTCGIHALSIANVCSKDCFYGGLLRFCLKISFNFGAHTWSYQGIVFINTRF